jgi:hypothetical protein
VPTVTRGGDTAESTQFLDAVEELVRSRVQLQDDPSEFDAGVDEPLQTAL